MKLHKVYGVWQVDMASPYPRGNVANYNWIVQKYAKITSFLGLTVGFKALKKLSRR